MDKSHYARIGWIVMLAGGVAIAIGFATSSEFLVVFGALAAAIAVILLAVSGQITPNAQKPSDP